MSRPTPMFDDDDDVGVYHIVPERLPQNVFTIPRPAKQPAKQPRRPASQTIAPDVIEPPPKRVTLPKVEPVQMAASASSQEDDGSKLVEAALLDMMEADGVFRGSWDMFAKSQYPKMFASLDISDGLANVGSIASFLTTATHKVTTLSLSAPMTTQDIPMTEDRFWANLVRVVEADVIESLTLVFGSSVNLSNTDGFHVFSQALGASGTLTSLSMDGIDGDVRALSFAGVIKKSRSIVDLEFGMSDVGPTGMTAIVDALCSASTTIRRLAITADIQNGQPFDGPSNAMRICDIVQNNKKIEFINLGALSVITSEFQRLSDVLATTDTILTGIKVWSLDLGSNWNVVSDIAYAMWDNKTIVHLDLSACGLNSSHARAIAGMLKVNSTLTHVNLNRSGFDTDSIGWIANSLRDNNTLTHMDMRDSTITTFGAQLLVAALARNRTLTHLDVSHSRSIISNYLVKHITAMLEVNTTIQSIHMVRSNIGRANNDNVDIEAVTQGQMDSLAARGVRV